jgi:hypothetical protein
MDDKKSREDFYNKCLENLYALSDQGILGMTREEIHTRWTGQAAYKVELSDLSNEQGDPKAILRRVILD